MNFLKRFQQTVPDQIVGGRYKVIDQLGVGGFSQTFLAEDLHLPGHPRCVVKQLKPQVDDANHLQTARRLFDTEAKVLYQLGSHDQIPRLLAHFEDSEEFYLVQELIEGDPLTKRLTSGLPWSEERVICLMQDILSVLTFVHTQNVIHRDIKPSNLICRTDGKIVLIDFGAVKQVSSQLSDSKAGQSMTISVGTQGYMPVEQLGGHPRFNSDIYAVGMVGIQALTGVHPKRFSRDPHTGEVDWRNLSDNRQNIRKLKISPEFATVLDRMVSYHFKDRYQTADDALNDLQALLEHRSIAPAASLPDEDPPTIAPGIALAEDDPSTERDAPSGTRSPFFTEIVLEQSAPNEVEEDESEPFQTALLTEEEALLLCPPRLAPQEDLEKQSEKHHSADDASDDKTGDAAGHSGSNLSPESLALENHISENLASDNCDAEDLTTPPLKPSAAEVESQQIPLNPELDSADSALDRASKSHSSSDINASPDLNPSSESDRPSQHTPSTDSIASDAETFMPSTEAYPTAFLAPLHRPLSSSSTHTTTSLRPLLQRLPRPSRISSNARIALIAVGVLCVGALGIIGLTTLLNANSESTRSTGSAGSAGSGGSTELTELARTVPLPPLVCNEPPLPSLPDRDPDYEDDSIQFYGPTKNGVPADGWVTIVYESGDRYDGELQEGKRNGCGTFTFANGRQYEGEFKDDAFEGQGIWRLENGDQYVGTFKNYSCHGEGVFIFNDGTSKQGIWQDGTLVNSDLSCDRAD